MKSELHVNKCNAMHHLHELSIRAMHQNRPFLKS